MAAAAGKVEFGSVLWMRHASDILADLVATHSAQLKGERISVCEVFLNAPVHLRTGEDDRVVWSFVIDDGALVQAPSNICRKDADLYVEVEYEDVVPRAKTILSDEPGAVDTRPPPRGGIRRGPAVISAPMRTVLRGLHNRLAEITQ